MEQQARVLCVSVLTLLPYLTRGHMLLTCLPCDQIGYRPESSWRAWNSELSCGPLAQWKFLKWLMEPNMSF